jgi:hypothetical protein
MSLRTILSSISSLFAHPAGCQCNAPTISDAAEQYRRAQISGTPEDKRAASEALDRAYRNMADHAGGAA